MLVLSRKVGQRILVGDEIAITVVRLTGGGVRLGIEAPPEMCVVREELAERMRQEGRPETEDQRPKTEDQKPETKDQRPKTEDQRLKTGR